jgi:hypothetical protein
MLLTEFELLRVGHLIFKHCYVHQFTYSLPIVLEEEARCQCKKLIH